jgi:hypothetical protein
VNWKKSNELFTTAPADEVVSVARPALVVVTVPNVPIYPAVALAEYVKFVDVATLGILALVASVPPSIAPNVFAASDRFLL